MTTSMLLVYAYLAMALLIAAGLAGCLKYARASSDYELREFVELADKVQDHLGLEDDGAFAVFIGLAWPILFASALRRK